MSNVYGLYIAGNTLVNKGSELYVAKLEDDNKTFSSITLLENNDNSFTGIYSMAVYNATLYIGGIANSYAYLARLDNNTNTFGKNLISNTKQLYNNISMTVYKEKLYFLGSAGGVAVYDGQNFFYDYFTYDGNTPDIILVMTSYKDTLYIGGFTENNDGIFNLYVATLESDNKTFSSITLPDGNKSDDNGYTGIYSMAVYDNNLYIGGSIVYAPPSGASVQVPYLASSTDGKTFQYVKDSDSLDIGIIYAMTQYNKKLYLMGEKGVVSYEDQKFSSIDTSILSTSNVTIYNGDLYASTGSDLLALAIEAEDKQDNGDTFSDKNSPNLNVYTLDNNKWTLFPQPINQTKTAILPMIDYNLDVLHADTCGLRIFKKNSLSSHHLKLILGLSIGLGIPVLGVIIFLMYKYIPRKNQ